MNLRRSLRLRLLLAAAGSIVLALVIAGAFILTSFSASLEAARRGADRDAPKFPRDFVVGCWQPSLLLSGPRRPGPIRCSRRHNSTLSSGGRSGASEPTC